MGTAPTARQWVRATIVTATLGVLAIAAPLIPVNAADFTASTSTPTALRFWASTNGGTSSDQVYTDAQAIDVARRFDVVVAIFATFRDQVAEMKAANPNLTLISYLNGAFADSDEGTLFPDSWYLRDAKGAKVRSVKWGNFLMDPANAGWRDHVLSWCRDRLSRSGYDGCYLDDLGSGNLTSGNLTGTPVNPRTGALYTDDQWIADTSGTAGYVRSQLGKPLLVNGLNNGGKYFDPSIRSSRLAMAASGGNAEGFLRGEATAVTQFRKEAQWQQDVDMLVDAGNNGRSVVAMTKIWISATSAQVTQWRKYTYASFLLGTNGNQFLYFNPVGPGKPPAAHPYDSVPIGTPSGAYAKVGGVYKRSFTNGMAFVNPTTAAVTVSLGGTYKDLDGNSRTSITLAPNTGEVVTGGDGGGTGGGTGATTVASQPCRQLTPTILGTTGDDTIEGTAGNDVIWTGAGNDVIHGNGGNDTICAGAGNDTVTGDDGDDWISGGAGDDSIYGNTGDDILDGVTGVDSCAGGTQVTKDVARDCETVTAVP